MAERRTSPLVDALVGALLGVLFATMAKGAIWGWDGGRGDWAWLNAFFGMVGGPFLLGLDYMTLTGKEPHGTELAVLPWAGVGAAIGAVFGLFGNEKQ